MIPSPAAAWPRTSTVTVIWFLAGITKSNSCCASPDRLGPSLKPLSRATLYRRLIFHQSSMCNPLILRARPESWRGCGPLADVAACLTHPFSARRYSRPQTDASAVSGRATDRAGAVPSAPGFTACGLLPVDCPGSRPGRDRGQTALGEDCGVAHIRRARPQLAPLAGGLGIETRLEAPTCYAKKRRQPVSEGSS